MKIERTWIKCKDCGCVWYDDGGNSFKRCPECGSIEFYVLEEEIIELTKS